MSGALRSDELLDGGAEHARFARILDEDPELGERLPADVWRIATGLLTARVVRVDSHRWEPPASAPSDNALGLLVLEGLFGRRVRVGRAVATELLGAGDILRPWDEGGVQRVLPAETDWRVFRPARLAVLDDRITAMIGRRPELTVAVASRLLRRVRAAHYLTAVSHTTRIEDRLLAVFWHLADNWGRVTPDGIRVPLRLTHEVLGEIVGAQRPSVTVALGRLRDHGHLMPDAGGGWILKSQPGRPFAGDDGTSGGSRSVSVTSPAGPRGARGRSPEPSSADPPL